jgi:protein-disulfide isomerase
VTVAAILIGISVVGTSGGASAQSRVVGVAETNRLLDGIPQHGSVLGRPNAPIRLVEYGDLQCPICRRFALDTLPTIVRDYVRPGYVQIEFRGLAFIGPDSERALRAVVAAGAQDRAWSLIDLMYRNQGHENSGWVTDSLLRSAGLATGLDTDQLFADRNSAATSGTIHGNAVQAQQDMGGEIRTPTFLVGRGSHPLRVLQIASLDVSQFMPAFDQLLGR